MTVYLIINSVTGYVMAVHQYRDNAEWDLANRRRTCPQETYRLEKWLVIGR